MPNNKKRSCLTIILAAGAGTRMGSTRPKVLHKIAGLEMVNHVVAAALCAQVETCAVVTGNQRQRVEDGIRALHGDVLFFEQRDQSGTANAVLAAEDAIAQGFDDILVLFGDTPLIRSETLVRMRQGLSDGADVAVLGFKTPNPYGYGRLIEKDGALIAIREHKEASSQELEINFCNGGIMAISGEKCLELVKSVSNENSKGEYYLTDIAQIASERAMKVVAHQGDEEEILGINTKVELAEAEAIWQGRKRRQLMLAGVEMIAPDSVYLSHDTQIGTDSVLEPHQVFGPGVTVGENVNIRAYCHFEQSEIGDNCVIGS
ncbi:MAG: NTP transferase domain-containing protein, partial [Rhizobiaceae bacterium]|nr:NTP transferase domain-containing protein [Rhizobiaceae bacterium]